MKNKITEKLMNDYQNNGWVKVKNFIAKKDISTVKKMINNNEISNNEIKFFMGYSGWHEDQLENEIKEKSWILDDSSTKVCMQKSNSELWSKIAKKKGGQYAIWSNLPINPNLN